MVENAQQVAERHLDDSTAAKAELQATRQTVERYKRDNVIAHDELRKQYVRSQEVERELLARDALAARQLPTGGGSGLGHLLDLPLVDPRELTPQVSPDR